MGYQHLQNAVKAIALTVPAARAFELTVEFVLGEGKDTATVGRLEDHFRDRPAMKACIERMKADPAAGKCIDDRYLGPELDLDKLIAYPRRLPRLYLRQGHEASGVRPAFRRRPAEHRRRNGLRHDAGPQDA
jgi:ubiquinone biosynthesis protein Coq4